MKCLNCPHGFHGIKQKCNVVVREIYDYDYDYDDVRCQCVVQPSLAEAAIKRLQHALERAK